MNKKNLLLWGIASLGWGSADFLLDQFVHYNLDIPILVVAVTFGLYLVKESIDTARRSNHQHTEAIITAVNAMNDCNTQGLGDLNNLLTQLLGAVGVEVTAAPAGVEDAVRPAARRFGGLLGPRPERTS